LKSKILIFILCIGFIIPFTACNINRTNGRSDKSGNSLIRFTFADPLLGKNYWNKVEQGIRDADKNFSVSTKIAGPSEIDANEQIKVIEMAISAKVDGIITMVLDPDTFTPTVNHAVEAGIPVILIDNDAPDSKRNMYIGTDNVSAGSQAGELMVKITAGRASIGIITRSEDAVNLNERIEGFKSVIGKWPEMKIVDTEYDNSDELMVAQKTQEMLSRHPELTAIFCSEGLGAYGVAKIIEEKNLAGKIKIIGFDDADSTLDYIRKGVIYGTIAQDPYQMGYLAVKYLKDIKQEKIPENRNISTGIKVITRDNLE
jgi:ribose transport system substrate-binding protein